MRERWMDMRRANPIDHFLPKSIRPDLSSTYDNLLYLCANCNGLKSDSLLPNPCAIALGNYLQVQADGAVIARDGSIEGECLIDELALNHRDFSDFRRRLMRMLEIAAKYDREQFVDWMKYPDDLPDLSLEKPDSNSRPDGVARSYYMARKHRFLPDVY
jgi:hypothetical protein